MVQWSPVWADSKVDHQAHIEEHPGKEAYPCSPVGGQLLHCKVIEEGPVDAKNGSCYGPGSRLHGESVGKAGAHDSLTGCQHQQLHNTAV